MLKETVCSFCHQAKPTLKNNLHCGVCQKIFCKDCLHFVETSTFSFLKTIPELLTHETYCIPCHEQHFIPAKNEYDQKMEKAKQITLFFKKLAKSSPVLRRAKERVSVTKCPDRSEALMRLAFTAAELSFNSLIEIELTSEKNVVAGYKNLLWTASAHPADVAATRHEEKMLLAEKPQPKVIPKGKKKEK